MHFRFRLQLAEAFGPLNRWFCSEAFGREIRDKETLLTYYIKSGGAEDFARRYDHATSMLNRWYCSERHGRDIRDPQILWDYYIRHSGGWDSSSDSRFDSQNLPELKIA